MKELESKFENFYNLRKNDFSTNSYLLYVICKRNNNKKEVKEKTF